MPLREYVCPRCGNVFDELYAKEYPKKKKCSVCGYMAEYRIGTVSFKFDFWYGWDTGAGEGFDSARQRNNFLGQRGLERNPDGAFGQPYGEAVKEEFEDLPNPKDRKHEASEVP